MNRIEHLAEISVRRGCGFALLAVLTVMWGLSYDMLLCLRSGAILVALVGAVLGVMAWNAPSRNPRSTELWAMLGNGKDLPPDYPPQILLEVLRETYIRHAELAGGAALALCAGAAGVWLLRG